MDCTYVTRLSAHGALAISMVSLSMATWVFGCDRQPKAGSGSQESAQPATSETKQTHEAKPKKTTETKSKAAKPKSKAPDSKPKTGKVESSERKGDQGAAPSLPKVKRLVVTTGVEKREPVKVDALLAGEAPIYAFMELANDSATGQQVVVTFEREDDFEVVGHIKLDVPAEQPRWRTWGRTHMIKDAGPWVAVVRTPDGHELARQPFDVSAS